jgi:hypothetical protein
MSIIEELASKARVSVPEGLDVDQWVAEYNNIFAGLIVDECLNQCYNNGMNDSLYEGQLKAAGYIEQHFGMDNEQES